MGNVRGLLLVWYNTERPSLWMWLWPRGIFPPSVHRVTHKRVLRKPHAVSGILRLLPRAEREVCRGSGPWSLGAMGAMGPMSTTVPMGFWLRTGVVGGVFSSSDWRTT